MTDGLAADIDSILSSDLPDREPEDVPSELDPRQAQMVQLLKEAADELDKSPSFAEFNALEYDVSADLIKYKFGTWNEAKEAADLEVNGRGQHSPININETYFQSIDTSAKAYWLGTLIATSSIQHKAQSYQYTLSLARTEQKSHFVIAFADAIDSEYAIH